MDEIKKAKNKAENFLSKVVKQEWSDASLKIFNPKDWHRHLLKVMIPLDWPIRLEAHSYLANKHRDRLEDFAGNVGSLWNKWIECHKSGEWGEETDLFWPHLNEIPKDKDPFSKPPSTRCFGSEIESHISMFRAKEILKLGGYNTYFAKAENSIRDKLFVRPKISLFINEARIIWQVIRSPLLRTKLDTYLKVFAEKIVGVYESEDLIVGGRIDKDKPSYLDIWKTFFLCFGNFGISYFDFARKKSEELIEKQKSNGSFDGDLLVTCLSASIIHATKVDPSNNFCNRASTFILKNQHNDGHWDFLSCYGFMYDTFAFKVLSTVVALETLDLITDDKPLPLWTTKLISRKECKKGTRIQSVVPFKTPVEISWDQIAITFTHEEVVQISVGDQNEARDFQQMGFCDRRGRAKKRVPDWIWKTLLEIAKHGGEISLNDDIHPRIEKNLKANIHVISARMKEIFKLDKSPFFRYKRKTKSWKSKFSIKDAIQE